MDKTWLNKKHNKKCILFFNGWGMDENAVANLEFNDFDVCMFNNYISLEDFSFEFETYDECYLIAWSLGVWAAANVGLKNAKIVKSIAINGSLKPKDNDFGIPPAIFEATANNWDDRNKLKFNMRMIGGRKEHNEKKHLLGNRETVEQRTELLSIDSQIEINKFSEIEFNTCLLGKKDLIFPYQNLVNYWKSTNTNVIEQDIVHYPFVSFKSWSQIIEL